MIVPSGQTTDAEHEAYYEAQVASNREFWRRFGGAPDVEGKRVIDLGCGHGALSVDMASRGATVTGVEIAPDRVEFARQRAARMHPELTGRLDFQLTAIEDFTAEEPFDLIVSKDTFEHVDDMASMLRVLHSHLRPGGELMAGFSPMYWSPGGDHGRTGLRVPWAHAVLPRSVVLASARRHNGRPIDSLGDVGMNDMTPAQFREYFRAAGFEAVSIVYNAGDKRLLPVLSAVRRVPALERFATVGIYAILRRTATEAA